MGKDLNKNNNNENNVTSKKKAKHKKKKDISNVVKKNIENKKSPKKNSTNNKKTKNKITKNKNKNMEENELFETEIEETEPISHIKEKTKKEIRAEKKLLKWKRDKIKKISVISLISVCSIYVLGCILFNFLCYPRTSVADVDLSFKTPASMEKEISNNASNYELSVAGMGFSQNIKGTDIDYSFDADTVLKNVAEEKNVFLWPVEIFKVHDFMNSSIINFNKQKASELLMAAAQNHNLSSVQPSNANIVYDDISHAVVVKQEVMGNTLDVDKYLNMALGCIGSGRKSLPLSYNEFIIPVLYSSDERINLAVDQANILIKAELTFVMGAISVATLNINNWAQWLELKENYTAGLNDDSVANWASALASQCNTCGKTKNYITPYGKAVTVTSGDAFGWKINEEELAELVKAQAPAGQVKSLEVPCSSQGDVYNGPDQRDWGARYIDVDLEQQHTRFYNEAGSIIWEADIVSGKPESPTPCGIYTIKQVTGPTKLLGEYDPATGKREYETVVQNWIPFIGNSIGFHDAYWQPKFGGNLWQTKGSHGCINLSSGDSSSLRGLAKVGDIVVVHS